MSRFFCFCILIPYLLVFLYQTADMPHFGSTDNMTHHWSMKSVCATSPEGFYHLPSNNIHIIMRVSVAEWNYLWQESLWASWVIIRWWEARYFVNDGWLGHSGQEIIPAQSDTCHQKITYTMMLSPVNIEVKIFINR